jgi:hypothetical protein
MNIPSEDKSCGSDVGEADDGKAMVGGSAKGVEDIVD